MHAFLFLKLNLRSNLSESVNIVMLDRNRGVLITDFRTFFPWLVRKSKRNCLEVPKLFVDKDFFLFIILLFYRVFHVPVHPITCMATTSLPVESELMGERTREGWLSLWWKGGGGDIPQFFTTSLIAKDSQCFMLNAAETKFLNSWRQCYGSGS